MLVLSQVVLSLQLSFAVIPLIHLVSDRRWMGQHTIKPWLQVIAWGIAVTIAYLNGWLAFDAISTWLASARGAAWLLWLTVVPVAGGLVGLLGWVIVAPLHQRWRGGPTAGFASVHGPTTMPAVQPPAPARRIAAAVDFSAADTGVLSHAVGLARVAGRGAEVVLLHVVESSGARLLGAEVGDSEARADRERLELYCAELGELGVIATYDLGFGQPVAQLAALVTEHGPQMLVMGSHGHRGVGDLVHGTTVESLRHRITVPILVVPLAAPG